MEIKDEEVSVNQKTIKCDGCEKLHTSYKTLRVCSYCRKAYYCTNICQSMHWPLHKLHCKKQATFTKIYSITKYFFGKYEWIISNNIHAFFSYTLILENGTIPTFKMTKQNRVQNMQEFREYIGTWYPVSINTKNEITSFEDIFKENNPFRLKLNCKTFQKEMEKNDCDKEFLIQFENLKSSPKYHKRVITKPFKVFNDSRVVILFLLKLGSWWDPV
jgi:hypothetical protein